MKIRNGFVSNSSSTSFCILGIKRSTLDTNEGLPFNKLIVEEEGIYDIEGDSIIGAPPNDMKDDETLLEFKTRIVTEINKIFDTKLNESDLRWYTDGGYDG